MLGIYCISGAIGREQLCRQLELIPQISHSRQETWASANGAVAAQLMVPEYRRADARFRDGNDWVLADGVALDPDTYQPLTAGQLHALLKDGGPQELHKLNGEFVVLASIGESVWLVSDRMGQRQHCLAEADGMTAFAPTPGAALKLVGRPSEIDRESFLTFLLSNKLRLDERSIWQHCRTMPAASQYSIAPTGQWSHEQYWNLEFAPDHDLTRDDIVSAATDTFRHAVAARLPEKGRIGMTLTGGLDSRLMAGAVAQARRSDIVCSTMGLPGCDEVELAKAVATQAGYSHRAVAIHAETAFSPEYASFLDDEEIDLVIQNCWQPFIAENRDIDVILHGLDLDVTLGGIYLTPELEGLSSHEELVEYAVRHALSGKIEDLSRLFHGDIMSDAEESIRARVSRMLDTCQEESILNTYDHFILRYSMHRVILQRYRAIRQGIDTISPMYDRRLIDLYLRMPPKLRAQHGVFKPVLMGICPELAGIAYQRTNLPPRAPRRFWTEGQRLEMRREELLRRIAHETQGKEYVPYMRYYTNVDEWLRFDPVWMQACDELLLGPGSLIREQYLNEARLDELVAEHRAHTRSHMKIIHILMSAELFLRRAEGVDMRELFTEITGMAHQACRQT